MSTPQLLEDEDVQTALRECSPAMLVRMGNTAMIAFFIGGDEIEVDLGHCRGEGDVLLKAKPSIFVEAILAEAIARGVPDAADSLACWREVVAQHGH